METNGILLAFVIDCLALKTVFLIAPFCLIALSNCCCSLHAEKLNENEIKLIKYALQCFIHALESSYTRSIYGITNKVHTFIQKSPKITKSRQSRKKTRLIEEFNPIVFYFEKNDAFHLIYCLFFDDNAPLLSCLSLNYLLLLD